MIFIWKVLNQSTLLFQPSRLSVLTASSVCSSLASRPTLQFLQLDHKISLIKVAWYMLRVKDKNSWSPLDLQGQRGKLSRETTF